MQIIVACRGSQTEGRKLVGDRSSRAKKRQRGACRTSSTMAPPRGVSPPLSGEGLRWFVQQDRNYYRSNTGRDGCVRPYLESEATGVDWILSPHQYWAAPNHKFVLETIMDTRNPTIRRVLSDKEMDISRILHRGYISG